MTGSLGCATKYAIVVAGAIVLTATNVSAGACDRNPDALGTDRTIVVDPTEHARVGTMSYSESLPLLDKEVVLTFDDGPLDPYTDRVLEILAAECVHATFFIVGRMAKLHPELVRRAFADGHTIGTHTMNHPLRLRALTPEGIQQEIDQGIEAVAAALGDPAKLAPFFRFPGLARTEVAEEQLASGHLMVWSADFPADDWRRIGSSGVIKRALDRLEAKGKGILLLHDIHARTVEALPVILKELRTRGYHVVHVVPATSDPPASETPAVAWQSKRQRQPTFPGSFAYAKKDDAEFARQQKSSGSPVSVDDLGGGPTPQSAPSKTANLHTGSTDRALASPSSSNRHTKVTSLLHRMWSALQNKFVGLLRGAENLFTPIPAGT
jgi:peptidoglycan/xylan/chitin deacetylase (PgdA/CDA1 family)